MILYLHGFRSSPSSFKARVMAQALAERELGHRWACPQLPAGPAQTLELCHQLIQDAREARGLDPVNGLVVVGSSLGGYFANAVAEHWGCRAVVLNPAVYPLRTLADQIGRQTRYHSDEPFEFLPQHLDELAQLAPPRPRDPSRYYLLACKGDEVLDWRDMADWYRGSQGHILEGGDHGIADFERWLPDILNFILAPAAPAGPG